MSTDTKRSASRPARARGVASLALPALVAFTLPPVGFMASLLLPLIASRVRLRLWPRTSPVTTHVCSALVVTGLWLPALLSLLSRGQAGSGATVWLIIPLCAPAGSALWVPALSASAAYLTGLAVSTLVRRAWPWVLGAWAAPLTYEAASRSLVDFLCFA